MRSTNNEQIIELQRHILEVYASIQELHRRLDRIKEDSRYQQSYCLDYSKLAIDMLKEMANRLTERGYII